MATAPDTPSLEGWDIHRAGEAEWVPWGETGDARAKVLGNGDGYFLVLVEAEAGYTGTPHEHAHAEFLYVLDGRLRTQGEQMGPGDGYAAATGSVHTDFAAEERSTYLSIFKL
jgi:quercetin dioxygenase-like cupin family protein